MSQKEDPQENMYQKELNSIDAIIAYNETLGGRTLINWSADKVGSIISELAFANKAKSSDELRALCASLECNLDLFGYLTGAPERRDAVHKIIQEMGKSPE